jgi:hypothetical protein
MLGAIALLGLSELPDGVAHSDVQTYEKDDYSTYKHYPRAVLLDEIIDERE